MRSRTVAEAFVVALALTACVVPQSGAPAVLSVAEALDLAGRNQAVFVDVRSAEAYARGHIPGAVNVPFPDVTGRTAELRRMRLPIFYCG
ncbi:MAG: rhodanese-like domain-containing protein [Vicinamibacteria bacterium]